MASWHELEEVGEEADVVLPLLLLPRLLLPPNPPRAPPPAAAPPPLSPPLLLAPFRGIDAQEAKGAVSGP
jgi:hypothetical protein